MNSFFLDSEETAAHLEGEQTEQRLTNGDQSGFITDWAIAGAPPIVDAR